MKRLLLYVAIGSLALTTAGVAYLFFFVPGIPVLNYHEVNNKNHVLLAISSQEFDAQMSYLAKAGYNSITPDQLLDYLQYGKPLPPNPVLITFDDGYEDNYQEAYPILKKYNFTATIFLITDFVDHNSQYLTWQQIKEMAGSGIQFQSHTATHIMLTKASDSEVLAQLTRSRKAIEQHLSKKVEYLAYPGGFYNNQVIELAKQAGYRAAFTINLGRDRTNSNFYTLNRIPVFELPHTFFHFWLRLKLTRIWNGLQTLKMLLTNCGASRLADLIYIP